MCIDNDFRLGLFGSEDLEDKYPDIYEESIDNNNIKSVILESKIVINLTGNFHHKNEINIISLYIMSSRSILMTNYNPIDSNYLLDNFNCLLFSNDYCTKLKNCLDNMSRFGSLGSNGAKFISDNLNISIWSQKVIDIVNIDD